MAQVILKKSSVTAKVPVTGDLAYGELALNYADGKLYFLKSDGSTISYFPSSEVIAGTAPTDSVIAKTFMMMGA